MQRLDSGEGVHKHHTDSCSGSGFRQRAARRDSGAGVRSGAGLRVSGGRSGGEAAEPGSPARSARLESCSRVYHSLRLTVIESASPRFRLSALRNTVEDAQTETADTKPLKDADRAGSEKASIILPARAGSRLQLQRYARVTRKKGYKEPGRWEEFSSISQVVRDQDSGVMVRIDASRGTSLSDALDF
ncbi:hypothetical protein K488DRAFT_74650 [Vararia minispora EC-137]|uniref:Uncharacterized protein n=1 Tax=Vararia minispora EC-137 TaxID=1314806 RepID=A0ACB8Q6Y3_9AGAM|nr:hypothetical protein K488DRAFT_74650 [Vararia minispora EC-137]